MKYVSLIDNARNCLDWICNKTSVKECADAVRDFAKSDHNADEVDALSDTELLRAWDFTAIEHAQRIEYRDGISREDLTAYNIAII